MLPHYLKENAYLIGAFPPKSSTLTQESVEMALHSVKLKLLRCGISRCQRGAITPSEFQQLTKFSTAPMFSHGKHENIASCRRIDTEPRKPVLS
jgi:hypothetical protein